MGVERNVADQDDIIKAANLFKGGAENRFKISVIAGK
jgi:hypothetical protein